jgi:hypothetical protein
MGVQSPRPRENTMQSKHQTPPFSLNSSLFQVSHWGERTVEAGTTEDVDPRFLENDLMRGEEEAPPRPSVLLPCTVAAGRETGLPAREVPPQAVAPPLLPSLPREAAVPAAAANRGRGVMMHWETAMRRPPENSSPVDSSVSPQTSPLSCLPLLPLRCAALSAPPSLE